MKNYSNFSVFFLILFIVIMAGCGGSNVTQTVLYSTPTAVPIQTEETIDSTLTEISQTSLKISASPGGEVTHKDLTITIPPGALTEDSIIKVSLVSITEKGVLQSNDQCYKISTDSTKEAIELNQSATVKIKVNPFNTDPVLYFWDSEEWVNPDSDYNTGELTFRMNCIYKDGQEWVSDGSEIEGPAVIEVINGGQAKDSGTLQKISSSKGNFIIECENNAQDNATAKIIGDYLEAGYDYYNSFGFKEPLKYIIDGNSTAEKYILVKLIDSDNFTAEMDPKGIMKIPRTYPDLGGLQSACLHEMYHLIEHNYSGRENYWSDWFSESTTEGISAYACNRGSFYDINSKASLSPREKAFISSIDKSSYPSHYHNFIFWSYIIGNYGGVNTFKKFFTIDNGTRNITWLNIACNNNLNKSLQEVYTEAYEDYYALGKFFNKNTFYSLSARNSGQPYYSERQYVFSDSSPYLDGKTVNLEHMSGKNVMFSSSPSEGSPAQKGTINIIAGSAADITVKLFYFKYSGGNYSLTGQEEIQNSKTLNNFGTDITDVLIIMMNKSLSQDKGITLKVQ